MTPFEAYKLYLAMRQHFERDSYDFIKYRGTVNVKETTFDTRKDKYMFYKLSKKPDPKGLLIANLCINPKMWVGDLLDSVADERFQEWNKRQQSMAYWFKSELGQLPDNLDELLAVPNNRYPKLLSALVSNRISFDLVVLLDVAFNFLPYWTRELGDDPIASAIIKRCQKYAVFLDCDRQRITELARERFPPASS